MSGGVDSSVAAALLVEAGHDVVGATMRTFCYSPPQSDTPQAEPAQVNGKTCCGLDGIMDARAVARRLGIPHHLFDVEEEFTRDVIDDFVSEYAQGRTPNPCVRCNSFTKFRDLLRRASDLGCTAIASGHYARVVRGPAGAELHRGVDRAKDQAYFLWGLPPALLDRLHLPLGALTKPEVRARARELGLSTAEKPESQEICFVPTGDYRDLLRRRLPARHAALEPGPLVTAGGEVVGMHDGYAGFTIGQRKGLGGGSSEPRFVLEVRPDTREVVVGPRDALLAREVEVEAPRWLAPLPSPGDEVGVQLRHRSRAVPARVREIGADRMRLELATAQAAVTPGQSAVVFDGERVLGGGRIGARRQGYPGPT
ncbi:MAG: tRNA 2-thiouridine(34) synthase MnmA [Gemmatimonadetes bacterium]|nr:tRNA 2-thiouridine(34) synthase MnmA [Gemmatimonadota bacterium]